MKFLVQAFLLGALLCTAAAADPPPAVAPALQARLDAVRSRIKGGDYKAADDEAEALRQSAESEYAPDSLEIAEALALSAETRVRNGKGGEPETRSRIDRALAIEEK